MAAPAVTTAGLVECSCRPFFVMYTVDAHSTNGCFNGLEFDAVKAMSDVSLEGWFAVRKPCGEEVGGIHAIAELSNNDNTLYAEEEEAAGYLVGSKVGYTTGMNQGFEQGYYEIVKAEEFEDQYYGCDDSSDSGSSEGCGTASSGGSGGSQQSGSGSGPSSGSGSGSGAGSSSSSGSGSSSSSNSRRGRRRLSEEEQEEEEQQEAPVVVPTSATTTTTTTTTTTPVEEEFRALKGEFGEDTSIHWMMGYVMGYKKAFGQAMEDGIALGREMGEKATWTDYDLGYEYGEAGESRVRKLVEANLNKNDNNNSGRNLHQHRECPLPFQKRGYDCVVLDTLDNSRLHFLSHDVVDVVTPNSVNHGLDFKNLLTGVMRGSCPMEEVQFELWQTCLFFPEE